MNLRPSRPTAYYLSLALALLVIAGCASVPTADLPRDPVAYKPVPSPARLDVSAAIEVTYDLAPEVRAAWRSSGYKDAVIELHRQAVVQALTADITNAGLFTQVTPADGTTRPDHYTLKIKCETLRPSDVRVRITFTLLGAPGTSPLVQGRETSLGNGTSPALTMSTRLPALMGDLKSDLIAGFQRKVREETAAAELAALRSASLAALLASSDDDESFARERNRAIIAAKNQQLPAILRDKKTDELSTLVVRIEQTILDLNHECEVAKDRAQQSVEGGGTPQESVEASAIAALRGRRGAPGGARTSAETADMSTRAYAFLGVAVGAASAEQVQALGIKPGVALVIAAEVTPGSPAELAGIQPGDAILSINGQDIPSPQSLQPIVRSFPPNTEVSVKFRRGRTEQTVPVKLGVFKNPAKAARPKTIDELRGLAISYRERIELLKPILTTLKEEIANRNR